MSGHGLKHESELEHLDPCVCTKNYVTGYVLDYDCGREIERAVVVACTGNQPQEGAE